MKADKPLSERQRIEREQQAEIRASLVRRHVEVFDEQHAIGATQIAMDARGPEFRALAARLRS